MPIKLNSPGGGSVTIDVPSMSTANTLTLPAITGNVITSSDSNTVTQTMINRAGFYGGFGPAFSAYQSSSQTLTTGTWTKISLQAEEFDTANCFDSTTNYRFTPNVAGYYQFNASVAVATSACNVALQLWKNGSAFKYPFYINAAAGNVSSFSTLVYANGSTDYFEFYAYLSAGQALAAQSSTTYFQAFLARPA
jgi:hypothetical protein